MSDYSQLFDYPYDGVKRHKRMSLANRAAQFAPFAALSGHDEAIEESARMTSQRLELSIHDQLTLSKRLEIALQHIHDKPLLQFNVFIPDKLKSGGKYDIIDGVIKKFDRYDRVIRLSDGKDIHLDDIISIDGEIFP